MITMNDLNLIVIPPLGRCDTTQVGETGELSDLINNIGAMGPLGGLYFGNHTPGTQCTTPSPLPSSKTWYVGG